MARLVTFATAAAVILVVSAATLFVGGTDVGAQSWSLNITPEKMPFRKWVVIHLDETDYRSEPLATVPKGFRLHVTDINFNGCSQNFKDDMAMNLTLWPEKYPGAADPTMPPPTDEIPRTILLISPRGIFRGMKHFGGSQQPNIFADQGETVWVEVYRTSSRLHADGTAWVQGFVEAIGER